MDQMTLNIIDMLHTIEIGKRSIFIKGSLQSIDNLCIHGTAIFFSRLLEAIPQFWRQSNPHLLVLSTHSYLQNS
ncbi:hypothetical protein KBAH04_17950 [Aeromonas hydrophila]|nr:hypothetical protein KBAH04_17950 [Aeromonas hydrophila]